MGLLRKSLEFKSITIILSNMNNSYRLWEKMLRNYILSKMSNCMSEFINNGEFRKNTLKNIIKKLHNGTKVEDIKKEFEDVLPMYQPVK